jgi:hypothetical protein
MADCPMAGRRSQVATGSRGIARRFMRLKAGTRTHESPSQRGSLNDR